MIESARARGLPTVVAVAGRVYGGLPHLTRQAVFESRVGIDRSNAFCRGEAYEALCKWLQIGDVRY